MNVAKPNFFIVGAPKCGTTALNDFLAQHPDIFMGFKEMHYFGADLPIKSTLDGQRITLDMYLQGFRGWRGEKRVGEAAILYLYSMTAPQEILAFDRHAKIIIMLRNPVDQMYSMYHQGLFHGEEDLPTFEEALAAEPDRIAGRRIPATCFKPMAYFYRQSAHYSSHVQRYFEAFGRENVLVILHDDFRRNNAGVYRQTLEFLGVDPDFEPEFALVNTNKQPRSRAVMNFIRKPPKAVREVKKLAWRVAPDLSVRLYNRALALNAVPVHRAPMSRELRKQLQAEFKPEIEQLGAVLERDLSAWYQS